MTWSQSSIATAALCISVLLLVGRQAIAQATSPSSPPTTSPPAGAAASSEVPDHISTTFGDWTLRCDRRPDLTPPQRVCELGLLVQKAGEAGAQAQIAVGRVARSAALQITAVVPPNLAFQTKPRMVIEGPDPSSTDLSWTRCIVGGCFADAAMSPALLNSLRSRTDPGRLEYRDGAGREVTLSVSLLGLKSALDALAREEAN
jgi:invasion protein IalB